MPRQDDPYTLGSLNLKELGAVARSNDVPATFLVGMRSSDWSTRQHESGTHRSAVSTGRTRRGVWAAQSRASGTWPAHQSPHGFRAGRAERWHSTTSSWFATPPLASPRLSVLVAR